MKKLLPLLLCLALVLSACDGQKKAADEAGATWQEQYDLGNRFLPEGKYEEALEAFTTAIGLDADQAKGYIGRADVYATMAQKLTLTDPQAALEALEKAREDYAAALERGDASMAEQVAAMDDAIAAVKDVMQAAETLGDALEKLGDAGNSVGDAPEKLGDAGSSVGDALEKLGDVGAAVGDALGQAGAKGDPNGTQSQGSAEGSPNGTSGEGTATAGTPGEGASAQDAAGSNKVPVSSNGLMISGCSYVINGDQLTVTGVITGPDNVRGWVSWGSSEESYSKESILAVAGTIVSDIRAHTDYMPDGALPLPFETTVGQMLTAPARHVFMVGVDADYNVLDCYSVVDITP